MTIEDENQWLYDLYNNFEEIFSKAVAPLDDYLVTFDKYKTVLSLDPDKIKKQLDVEDPD